MKVEKVCENCKQSFLVELYRKDKARFCSVVCRSKVVMSCLNYWKGKTRSAEDRAKISKSTSKENHYRWAGNERKDSEGYVFVRAYDHPHKNHKGMIRKHKEAMENYLGCIVPREWEIHHIDKNKENNNLSNLMLFKSKSAHRRFEMGGKYENHEIIVDGRKECLT